MSKDGLSTKWHTKIAENFNRLSKAHERYRQTQMIDKRIYDDSEHELKR